MQAIQWFGFVNRCGLRPCSTFQLLGYPQHSLNATLFTTVIITMPTFLYNFEHYRKYTYNPHIQQQIMLAIISDGIITIIIYNNNWCIQYHKPGACTLQLLNKYEFSLTLILFFMGRVTSRSNFFKENQEILISLMTQHNFWSGGFADLRRYLLPILSLIFLMAQKFSGRGTQNQ